MRTSVRLAVLCALSASVSSAHAFSIDTVAGRGVGDKRQAKSAGLLAPRGVAVAGDAILVGDSGHGLIRRVQVDGTIDTFAGTYPGTFGDLGPADVAALKMPLKPRVAANGDVIVAEYGADVVRRISNGIVSTIAGQADDPGFSGDGNLATSARLDSPADAFMDASGNVYIADSNNHRIRMIDGTTGKISTIAGTGTPGYAGNGGLASAAQLNNPVCVVPGAGGTLYVCDFGNHAIRRIDPDGNIRGVAGKGFAGFRGDGKKAKKALLDSPSDVAFEANGNVLIADSGNQRVRRINMQVPSRRMTTVAGDGTEGYLGSVVPAASPLGDPSGLAVHPDGRILIAEASNNRVRALSGGTLVDFAGDGVATFGGDGGQAIDATFSTIHGVTVDGQGNMVIADQGANNRIRRVDALTGIVTTIGGTGSTTFSGDGGPALEAGLSVSDVTVDPQGNIVFSDTKNHRVRRINLAGVISTIVGTGEQGFSGDGGLAPAAKINSPTGVAFDVAGNLYLADFLNNRIRRVDAATNKITTVAGNGAAGYNGDAKLAVNASLNNPTDVAFDASGSMYIADFRNHRVRVVTGGQIATFAGTGTAGDNSDGPLTPTTMQLDQATDVQVDADGNVYIVDMGNNKVRRVSASDGGMRTIAGSGLAGLRDRANALNGRMSQPLRIHLLSDGSLLLADNWNFVIRMLQP